MSEDVSRFLSQVKELGERRIEEDEARSRELEEKILQDRKERQARRAERARSISPQKSSPANTPPPSTQYTDTQRSERLALEASPVLNPPSSPQSHSAPQTEDIMTTTAPISTSPSKENELPLGTEIKANFPSSPTRSGPAVRGLSWQRRPNSQASERSRSRPLSIVAAENAARSSTPASEQTPTTEDMPRDQITPVLSPKDSLSFRQTTDRGVDSTAFKSDQVEDIQTVNMSSARTQLPGISPGTPGESLKNGDATRPKPLALRSTVTSPTSLSSAQRLDPPGSDMHSDAHSSREMPGLMSPPPLGRTSPTRSERPISPTKGTGGFVQSAMMKRSDSVNKRWSVQSPTRLQRADSAASTRPTSLLRGISTEPLGPGSNEDKEEDRPASRTSTSVKQHTTTSPEPQGQDSDKITPPTSPSKTMDPRRWSPQKSSWLESALNKPESPKPKPTPPPSSQPAWMAELQKAKAQKAANMGPEGNKSPTISHKHQVSIGGLMRSTVPSMTAAPVGRAGLHSPSPSVDNTARSTVSTLPLESQLPTIPSLVKSKSEPAGEVKSAKIPPPINKPKPETPPKKDFRASLRPRAPTASTSTGSQEVEFKNVFGNLRKTTTQNYVAPDELKNNITRGKASLSITGGPQKSERVDEFKEAILARKKEFQAAQSEGRGVARNNSISSENQIPEGLLKRNELGRSNTMKRDSVVSDASGIETRRPSTVLKRDSIPEPASERSERFGSFEKRGSIAEFPGSKQPGPTTESSTVKEHTVSKVLSGPANPVNETSARTRLSGKVSGGALANRFNPALAGLLARGPPPMNSSSGATTRGTSQLSSTSGSNSETDSNEAGSGPKLTHMTKNRARGPKRKAPTTSSASAIHSNEPRYGENEMPHEKNLVTQHGNSTLAQSKVTTLIGSSARHEPPMQPRPQPITLIGTSKPPTEFTAPAEVAAVPSKTGNKIHEQVAAFAVQRQQPLVGKITDETEESYTQTPSPKRLNMNRISRFVDVAPPAGNSGESEQPKTFEAPIQTKVFLNKPPNQGAEQKPQPRSPSLNKPKVPLPEPLSLPSRQQSSKAEVEPTASKFGGKASTPLGARPLPITPAFMAKELSKEPAQPLPKESEQTPRLLPSPGLRSPSATVSPLRSPTKQSHDTAAILKDFFGSERPRRDYRVDAAELLMQRPDIVPPKIQTLSTQLFLFSADGKKQPVPAHHERTLFEREMYLCSHTFKDLSGRRAVEIYFWTGDGVPRSSIEDAAIFVAREARSFGGTLINMQQGKETPEFLQALGGIVITQRGSGNKYDSLAPHMLCGRRYRGHVVFDEVDFTPSALCSGFPYLITQAGRCYLWKGKGSSIDELSCARLIGMDYALSGEMEEVEESGEPAMFWDLFDGANRFGSADHWRLKPNYDKYCSRLFLSNAASKQQIVELSPFSQTDLQPTSIYIIDAFFELYIVVGSGAQSQYASFHNALDFAQEYAILAAGMEDRPFVPISTVVLEGIPRDMKSVFRKWQDTQSPTITNANVGLKRGRSLKIVSLNQALQALSD